MLSITERSTFLIKYIVIFDPSIYFSLNENSETHKLIISGILFENSPAIRSSFSNLVKFIVINTGITNTDSLSSFLQKFFTVETIISTPEPSELCEAIVLTLNYPKSLYNGAILTKKLKQALDYLMSNANMIEKPSKSFLGLLKIVEKLALRYELLSTEKKVKIIDVVFHKWLFPSEMASIDSKYTRCHHEVREQSYKLLETLAGSDAEATSYTLRDCIFPLSNALEELKTWGYIPSQEEGGQAGHKGIKNLGNICYLIAVLQQFFCVAPFRNAVLSLSRPKTDLLLQLQQLFAFMKYSIRRDANPSKFCSVFKEADGKPLNISLQRDAHEFFNMFCERVEKELGNTEYKDLLKDIFGGRVTSQVKCKRCGSISSTFEDFYDLSLEIKNQKNLVEALYRYIEEGTVLDYNCERCNKKGEVSKRTLLADFPNVLIVHLQRFTFNLDILANEKIHSRLEFPNELDMYPFTVEAAEAGAGCKAGEAELKELNSKRVKSKSKTVSQQAQDNKFLYNLIGVLIHSGNADAGHYYSYISTRDGNEAKWREFNDSHISDFDVSLLRSQAFGEDEHKDAGPDYGDQRRSKSAYMLFYERAAKTRVSERICKAAPDDVVVKANTSMDTERRIVIKEKDKSLRALHRFDKVPLKAADDLLKEVKKDNFQCTYEKLIYSQEFISFVCTVFANSCQLVSGENLYLRKIGHKMLVDLFPHIALPAGSVQAVERAAGEFIKLLSNEFSVCKSLLLELTKSPDKTFSLLIICPEDVVRQYMSQLLLNSFITCITFEAEIFNEPPNKRDTSSSPATPLFFDMLIKFLGPGLSSNSMRLKQYFELLRDIVFAGGYPTVKFAFSKDLLGKLLELFFERRAGFADWKDRHHGFSSAQDSDFGALVELASFLTQKLRVAADSPSEKEVFDEDAFEVSESVKRLLRVDEMLVKHICAKGKAEQIGKCVVHLCRENRKNSRKTCQALLQLINDFDGQEVKECLEILYEILSIADSLQRQRLEMMLGLPLPKIKQELFTAYNISTPLDEINTYISPMRVDYEISPLLKLLWDSKDKSRYAVLYSLMIFFKLVQEYDICYQFFKAIPSPNYVNGRYTDWVRDFLETYPLGQAQNEIKLLKTTLELFKQYENRLNAENLPMVQQYIIGNVQGTYELKRLEKTVDEVTVSCVEVYTDIYPSIPKKQFKAAANDPNYLSHFIKTSHDQRAKTDSENHSSDSTAAHSESAGCSGFKGLASVIRVIAFSSTSRATLDSLSKDVGVKVSVKQGAKANFYCPAAPIEAQLEHGKYSSLYL